MTKPAANIAGALLSKIRHHYILWSKNSCIQHVRGRGGSGFFGGEWSLLPKQPRGKLAKVTYYDILPTDSQEDDYNVWVW